MKIKKINSIHYGGKVIGMGLTMMLLIPGILLWLNTFCECRITVILAKILFVIGGLLLGGFACLLFVELRQDNEIDKFFAKHKNVKIEIKKEQYECGVCGNRNIRKDSTYCGVCGCKYN